MFFLCSNCARFVIIVCLSGDPKIISGPIVIAAVLMLNLSIVRYRTHTENVTRRIPGVGTRGTPRLTICEVFFYY